MILREKIDGVICESKVTPAFEEEYQLIVAGLGTAGAISLIAAGREGISVLGVERLYTMGGIGTIGGITGYYFGARGGLYAELDKKEEQLRKEGEFQPDSRRDTLSLVMQREAVKCGAVIRYGCVVTGVYLEDNKVQGLRLFSDGKETAVKADMVIDATGEANVCFTAGCAEVAGREFDGQTQPATCSSFLLDEHGRCFATNKDAGFVKQQDPRQVSRVIIRSHTFPMYLKEDYTKDKTKFAAVSSLFGVREGRRIKGKKTLHLIDAAGLAYNEEEPLFYAFSNVDNHGKDIAFENRDLCDWMVACGLWGVLMSVPVPMGVLLPENLENIAVAGRCLSVDHNLAACVRMKSDMAKSGEAAAILCCEAIRKKISLSDVKYGSIVERLKATGCLDEANHLGYRERVAGEYFGRPLPVLKTEEEILNQLSGEKPGWGIWAARQKKDCQTLKTKLEEAMHSENTDLARHAALALGIMGEKAARPMLRLMAAEPDNYVPKSSLKYVYTRGVSAIYLLGRLGDESSAELLLEIVKRRGKTELDGFTFGEFYNENTDVYSQYVLFAARALTEITERHTEKKQAIGEALRDILSDPEYRIRISLRENTASVHDLKPQLMEYLKDRLS